MLSMKYFILISFLSLTVLAQEKPLETYSGVLDAKSNLAGAPCEIQILSRNEDKVVAKLIINDGTPDVITLPLGLNATFKKNHYSLYKQSTTRIADKNDPNKTVAKDVTIDSKLSLENPIELSFHGIISNSNVFVHDTIIKETYYNCQKN
jgi:hypothetical protein